MSLISSVDFFIIPPSSTAEISSSHRAMKRIRAHVKEHLVCRVWSFGNRLQHTSSTKAWPHMHSFPWQQKWLLTFYVVMVHHQL